MNTSLIIFFKQATKKLTFGIDESHSGLIIYSSVAITTNKEYKWTLTIPHFILKEMYASVCLRYYYFLGPILFTRKNLKSVFIFHIVFDVWWYQKIGARGWHNSPSDINTRWSSSSVIQSGDLACDWSVVSQLTIIG